MSLQGKGFYTFILPETEGGDPAKLVSEAQQAGLSHVLVKIADGSNPFGFTGTTDHTLPVVKALQTAGIQVWGWHYVYGDDPQGEASVAVSRSLVLGVDGYVVDAEVEYKHKNQAATAYMAALRDGLPNLPIALSSFRFPNYHPELPWKEFLEKCDLHMPQVYWEQSHNVEWQLRESKRQCDALPNARPYNPTGAAYSTPGWEPTEEDIHTFMDTTKELGLDAVNFFQWGYCRKHLPNLWAVIADYEWPFTPIPTPPDDTISVEPPTNDFTSLYITTMARRNTGAIAELYAENAIHIRNGRQLDSPTTIKREYGRFFNGLPASVTIGFTLFEGDGNTITAEWNAIGGNQVTRGSEMIELANGKIIRQTTNNS